MRYSLSLSRVWRGAGVLCRRFRDYASPSDAISARSIAALERTEAQIEVLQARATEQRKALGEKVTFRQVLPAETALIEQLVKNERVHPVGLDEMKKLRVGDEDANKRSFARIVRIGRSKQEVAAGIFTALLNVDLQDGQVAHEDLPGDIDAIKAMDVEPYEPPAPGQTSVAVLYTISGAQTYDWVEGGRKLASEVYRQLQEEAREREHDVVITTLSPVRKFNQWLYNKPEYQTLINAVDKGQYYEYEASEALLAKAATQDGRDEMRRLLLQYLLEAKQDKKDVDQVMNFHLGNGAYIGDVKFNRDNRVDWVMLNYVYAPEPERVGIHQKLYKEHRLHPLAPHLYSEVQYFGALSGLLSRTACVSSGPSVVPTPAAMPRFAHKLGASAEVPDAMPGAHAA